MNPQRSKLLPLSVSQKPAYAVHLRLTPELKEALLNAKAAGHSVSVRLGNEFNKTALTVGHQEFLLTTTEEGSTDLIAVPPDNDADGTCAQVGIVKQKLHVQKTAGNIDRERIRASAEEVERRQRERRAVVVTASDMKGDKRRTLGTTTTTTTTIKTSRTAPAPSRTSGGGLPPKPLSSGPSAPRNARAPSPTPAPAPQPKPMEIPKPAALKAKAAALKAKRTPPPPSQPPRRTPPPAAPDASRRTPPPPAADTHNYYQDEEEEEGQEPLGAALLAAARTGDLRQCVLAALAPRPLGRSAVLDRVRAAYRAVRVPAPEDSEVLDTLRQAATRDPASGLFAARPDRNSAATPPAPSPHERPPRPAAAAPKRPRAQDPFADLNDDSPPHRPPLAAPAPKRLRPAAAAAAAAVDPGPPARPTPPPASTLSGSGGGSGGSLEGGSPPSRGGAAAPSSPHSWRAPPSSTAAAPSNGHTHHHHHHHHHHAPPSDHHPTYHPSSSRPASGSRQASPYHSAATTEGAPASADGSSPPQREPAPPSAPRVVPDVDPDEGEYAEWVGRQPVAAEAISSSAQLEEARAQYTRRWGPYFRLHTKIEDWKNEMSALYTAAEAAADAGERGRLEGRLKEAALRKGRMSNRWSAAIQVLHVELASIRKAVEEYIARTGLLPLRPSTS